MKALTLTEGAYNELRARFNLALTRGNFAYADSLIPRLTRLTDRAIRKDNAQYHFRKANAVRLAPHERRGYE